MFQEFELSRLQKRIVVAGIDGKELSPNDIYRAMNTKDRDTYDLEVTGLRTSGILHEIRSSAAAQQMAKSRRTSKGEISRFRVSSQTSRTGAAEARPKPAEIRRELFPEETGVFVGNLSPQVTESDIRSVFERFGVVRKIILRHDARSSARVASALGWGNVYLTAHFANPDSS